MTLRRPLLAAALVCAVGTQTPPAKADATADARKAIQAIYNKENAAAAKKDVKGMFASYSPDYEATDKNGNKVTLAAVQMQLSQMLPAVKSMQAKSAIQKFTLKGSQAVVLISEKVTLTMPNPQTQKSLTMDVNGTSEDTWVKSAKGWMKKRGKQLSQKMMMDGKPFEMPSAPPGGAGRK